MEKEERINRLIKAIRESFGSSIAVYTMGNCYQFYEILKAVFDEAEAYYDGNHVWTKIGENYYDIRGKKNLGNTRLVKVEEPKSIESLSRNKWTDERRMKLKD